MRAMTGTILRRAFQLTESVGRIVSIGGIQVSWRKNYVRSEGP